VSEVASSPAAAAVGSRLVEQLGNGGSLEMALMPGGAFIMGAPPGEPDSEDYERPGDVGPLKQCKA
jgi:formylglycine-generating enzyme required for sulfatase activity